MGIQRGQTTLKVSEKYGKIRKWGVFSCIKNIKISFPVRILIGKNMLWKLGIYHDFNT